jgi:hypothetical protein
MNTKTVYRTKYDAMGNEEPRLQAVTLYAREYVRPSKIMNAIVNIVLALFVLALMAGMFYGMSIILKG